ncbi:MAG: HAD family hydrolase [Erysipelotrichaceae bacterium]|nr:HAD family hydrolase [Erysipelotrichaceae bacterium]
MKYSTIIFDLDGTLLNTIDDLADAVNHTMKTFGWPGWTRDDVMSFVGNGLRRLMELSVPEGENNPLFEEAVAEQRRFYQLNCNNKTAPYEGVLPLMEKLKDEGYKLAIVSNKADEAVKELDRIYFAGLTDVAVGESAQVRKKPHPDTVLRVMELLGSRKEECLYVGDSEVDIMTAQNAGIDCAGVLWGFRSRKQLLEAGAEVMAENTEELYEYIRKE